MSDVRPIIGIQEGALNGPAGKAGTASKSAPQATPQD
jgi:hypothetical protein